MGNLRKIIYLYDYENDTRGASAGFAKISKKETRIKVDIHLSGKESLYNKKVYLLVKDDNATNKLLFDAITSNGMKAEIAKENMGKDKITGEVAGVILCEDDSVCYAGTDDNTIDIKKYIYGDREKLMAAEEPRPEPEEQPQSDLKTQSQPEPEELSQSESGQQEQPLREVSQPEEPEYVRVEIEEIHDEAYQFKKVFQSNANMYPFEDDEMKGCVQISPATFSDFPKEYWNLAGNTFLLQGYYNYRHLILACTGEKIYVGIPGQYHKRDRYLAEMFGFGRFKTVLNKSPKLGDFGYWMMEIEAPSPTEEWCPEN